MPRKGYDVTGCAPGTPAAEAAARARQRAAPGNSTPRAGTPANPSRHDGDEQETPRASRIGVFAGNTPAVPPAYSLMNVLQDDRGFQIQQRLPRQELYQNPLNISSIQAANGLMARPISGPHGHPAPFESQPSMFLGVAPLTSTGQGVGFVNAPAQLSTTTFRTADFGAQQQQLWNNNQFYSMPSSQHGIQSLHMSRPGPESFAHYQTAVGAVQHQTANTNAGTSASQSADEDTEMAGVDR
ncbi:uncharacterized protein TRIVIDRAFT_220773 [Trichoderma virens Gv29-8]|uniref:Uncharacterized protein n=1 Tax=Hypocrea virens (strain Gv29-8 / FGSC 10586) TaxID=413071 RepID=G9MNQ3_HYPVG|nr:uncharacterized protein TRIVIDRAFT_220773 [Trichoderma virens Gv29-8]EHK23508.1 hypothetical protein TRIVIDRAFT_220773 [Trichoderma virens Gv29-8]UKZ49806.1 hypothetical protein TrVGV298_004059 [Trichoderma virens]